MRLLVTGGAGFIGSNFVRQVLSGALPGFSSVTILDKLTYAGTLTNLDGLDRSSFEFVRGDICDADITDRLSAKADVVINFAAESHVDRSIAGARDFVMSNVLGVQNLLDSARKQAVGVFIQVSTDEVYGTISEGSWDETEPLLPNSPYAASKGSGDLLARSYYQTFDLDVRVTRCSNNYGPRQFPEKLIPLFISNLIDGERVPIYGDGANVRDWLHVEDHCAGIYSVMSRGRGGEIYNIGGGKELTNLTLTHQILSIMKKDSSSINFVEDRLGHDKRYSVNYEKISNECGYRPRVDFETGLKRTVEWYLENESWWRPLKSR